MAQLSNRDDNFIATLMAVSGRVRTTDLHALSPAEAAEMLRAYQAAHPELGLGFDGETLVAGATFAAAPAPAVDAFAAPAPAPEPFPAPGVEAPTPMPGEFGMVEPTAPVAPEAGATEGLPAWVYESGTEASAVDLSDVPAPVPAGESGEPSFAGDFEPLPDYESPLPEPSPSGKMAWWWWVIAALFAPIGGLVGYFVVKGADPRGAKGLVILTFALFVLGVAAALGAVYFLGMGAGIIPFL